ncbi:hypothetical protein C0989_009540 [Termitomyces sp. Mn162]|nr:hypothetical protein C0989_009540 [Termitomyces sp. Mn162]
MPNPPTNANYFRLPTPGGLPQWAPGPAPSNAGQPPGGEPPNGGPSGGWGPAMDNFSPQCGNRNNYYYYYNAGPLPQAQNPQDNTRNALAQEGKLNIQKPEPFTSHDPQKWQIFLTQCLTMFQAKPITFQLESSRVAFTMSYLQGIAFDHYTALLRFDPNNPVLSNWLAFTQEFSSQGITSTNQSPGQHPPAQLNAADLHETPEPLDTNPDDHNDIPDPANNKEALCANRIWDSPWIDVPEEMQEKQWKEGVCILYGLEDALDRGPDPDIFSTLATLLHAMILTPDSPPVHLPSHSSTNLLLHTTLPFTDNPIPTLVDSGATNNFIDESLAVLAPHPLQHLPALIPLKLFDRDPTPAGDITHCLEMTMTFANGQQQEL